MGKDHASSSSHNAVRGVAASSTGVVFGAALSTVMPWCVVPTAISGYYLYKNGKKLKEQRRIIHLQGERIAKRHVTRQVIEGLALKGCIMFVTLGNDDVLALTTAGASQLFSHGAVDAAQNVFDIGIADGDRTDGDILGFTTAAASAPTTLVQEGLGLGTVENVTDPGQGWHADLSEVMQQTVVVGSAQAVTEQIIDSTSKPVAVRLDVHADKRYARNN